MPKGQIRFHPWSKKYYIIGPRKNLIVDLQTYKPPQHSMELNFVTADGKPIKDTTVSAVIRGEQRKHKNDPYYFDYKPQEGKTYHIKDGQLFVGGVVPGGVILLNDQHMKGYLLKSTRVTVPDETHPGTATVECHPAGAVSANILSDNIEQLTNLKAKMIYDGEFTVGSTSVGYSGSLFHESIQPDGNLLMSPVALEMDTSILLTDTFLYYFSPKFKISEQEPFKQTEIHLPPVKPIQIEVLTSEGQPVEKVGVNIDFQGGINGDLGFPTRTLLTNEEGIVSFNVFDLSGQSDPFNCQYVLKIISDKWQHPEFTLKPAGQTKTIRLKQKENP